LAILASLALAAVLASGSTTVVVGCGGGNSSSGSSSGGQDSGAGDTSTLKDSGPVDSNTPDTNMVVDTGLPDTHVEPQLAAPSFTPPGPAATVQSGQTVAINPPAGLPMGGQLFYSTSGGVPNSVTGTLYVGPIQITNPETIVAIAHDPANNFSDSLPASIVLTITLPDGGLPIPTFNPPSESQNNDFLVSLSTTSGGTICYTLDGTVPTCSAGGVCTGTSQTYNAASRVSINGTVTNAATGDVTVTALACEAGQNSSPSAQQFYSLIVADPTMVLNGNSVPTGTGVSNVPWPTGQPGLLPTVSTLTNSSIIVADNVSIWYSTTAAAPTCITGSQTANPTTFGAVGGGPILNANTTYQTIGCKQGYLHSNVATFPFTIQMNPPVLAPGGAANPYGYTFALKTSVGPNGVAGTTPGIVDSANSQGATVTGPGGSPDWVCPITDGSTPKCGTTFGLCATAAEPVVWANGRPNNTFNQNAPNVPPLNAAGQFVNATPTTTVTAIACGLGVNPSTSVTTAYTLQIAAPWLLSGAGLPATPLLPVSGGAPGWNTTTGAPTLGMAIPSGFAPGGGCPVGQQCYGPLNALQVGDPGGVACTDEQPTCTAGGATTCTESYNCPSGAALNQTPDYYCYIKNGTAACGTPTGGVAACAAGTAVNPGGGAVFASLTSAVGPGTFNNGGAALALINAANVGVSSNDKVSVIGCQNAVTEPSATPVFAPSQATTVSFSAPGAATAPNIPTPTGTLTAQAVVTVTNNDANPSTVCFTVDGSIPKCTPTTGVCNNNGTGTSYCGINTGVAALLGSVAVANGSNAITFSTAQTLAVGTALVFASQPGVVYYVATTPSTTTATLTAVYTGTTSALTTISEPLSATWEPAGGGGCGGAAATDGSLLGKTGSATASFTIPAGPTTPAPGVPPAGVGLLQKDGQVINAIACNTSEPSSSVSTQTYHFIAATPDFTATNGVLGALNGGGSVGAGTCVNVTDTSNFDSALATTPQSIHWSWTTAATCGSPNFVNVQSVTGIYPSPTVPVWIGGAAPANCAAVPTNVTTATLSAIACGENSTIQQSTNARTAIFNIATATPVFTTNESTCDAAQKASLAGCPAGSCFTAGPNTCPAVTPWDNDVSVTIASPTPNATLCWGTGTVSCSAGNCSGTGVTTVTGGATGPTTTVTITPGGAAGTVLPGSTINAVACTAAVLSPSGTASQAFVLQVSPVAFSSPSGSTLTCPTACGGLGSCPSAPWNVGGLTSDLVLSQDITTATLDLGGPTTGAIVCWTTDLSAVSAPNCAPGANTTTQCAPIINGVAGVALNLLSSTTLNTLTCKNGYVGISQATPYTLPPYRHAITVDGNISEWVIGNCGDTNPINNNGCTPGEAVIGNPANEGYMSYDGTSAYFAFDGKASYVPGPHNWLVLHIGNGIGANSAIDLPPALGGFGINEGNATPPGVQYDILWQSDGTQPATLMQWQNLTATWVALSSPIPKVGYSGTPAAQVTHVEISVPLASIGFGLLTKQTLWGAIYSGVNNGNPANVTPIADFRDIGGTTGGHFADIYSSCLSPNQAIDLP
jgi:hypothetical protein